MLEKNMKVSTILLYIFFCTILNAQAAPISVNFLFYNNSKKYILKVVPGKAHSYCINPDRYDRKKTMIYPYYDAISYQTSDLDLNCAGLTPDKIFVSWDLTVYNEEKKLCSLEIQFVFFKMFFYNRYRGWVLNDQQMNLGKVTRCTSIQVQNPYRLGKNKALSNKNTVKIIFTK